jgi:hypothetical protein
MFFPVIPNFLATGLLPQGVHWASGSEIRLRFGTNAHRARLLGGLDRACRALAFAGCGAVFLDGSFATEKDIPSDYDACWDMVGVSLVKLDPVLQDFGNLRAAQKAKYFGEFFPAQFPAKPAHPFQSFFDFFQIDKLTGDPKGIIGINLKAKP